MKKWKYNKNLKQTYPNARKYKKNTPVQENTKKTCPSARKSIYCIKVNRKYVKHMHMIYSPTRLDL